MKRLPWWHTELGEAEEKALLTAFRARRLTLGPVTRELEQEIGELLEVRHVILTSSGTAALTMALLAHDIGPGDEVIVPDLTWIATAQAAQALGATVVLADCRPNLPLIDPADVARKVTDRTRAIIPVHLNGRGCDLEALETIATKAGAVIIEDTCKAFASKSGGVFLGTTAQAGCFSLGMISIVSAGYGGCVVTQSDELAARLRLTRDHGTCRGLDERYEVMGLNLKISDLLAAVAKAQMPRIGDKIKRVRAIYELYREAIEPLPFIDLIPVDVEAGEIPLLVDVCSPHAREIVNYLDRAGIDALPFHPPLHEAPYLRNEGSFPNASRFAIEGFNLPCGPGQSIENIQYCIKTLRSWPGPVSQD